MDVQRRALGQLARLFRVQVAYCDVFGKIRQPSSEALLRILDILGGPVDGLAAAPDALRVKRRALWQRCLEPVIVAWDGSGRIRLRLPASQIGANLRYEIHLDTGAVINGAIALALPTNGIRGKKIDGVQYLVVDFRLPHSLPFGYHRFRLHVHQNLHESLLIAAPRRAYEPPGENHRQWGIFAPLYAFHSKHSWGAGNFSDLERMMDWTENLGGQAVATLPLLPTFLDQLFEPSPYSPVSRLYWNEFYVDPTRAVEFAECPSVRAQLNTLESSANWRRSAALRWWTTSGRCPRDGKSSELCSAACWKNPRIGAPSFIDSLKIIRDMTTTRDFAH